MMCDELSSPSLEPRGVGLCSFQDLAEGEWPQEGRWPMDRLEKMGGLGIGDDDFTGNHTEAYCKKNEEKHIMDKEECSRCQNHFESSDGNVVSSK